MCQICLLTQGKVWSNITHKNLCSYVEVKKDQVDDLQRNSVQKTSLNKTSLKSVATVKT